MATAVQEKLIFGSSVEALLSVARGKVSSDATRKLESIGMGLGTELLPAYPAATWAQAVRLIGAELFPGDLPEVQHNKVGRLTVQTFVDSLMGKALFAAARVFGARRSLARLTHNLRTGANFIETRFSEVDAVTWELWMNDVSDVPGFYCGIVEAGHDLVRGRVRSMRVKQRDGAACLFELKADQPAS